MSKARRASLIAAGAALIQLLTVGAALSDPSQKDICVCGIIQAYSHKDHYDGKCDICGEGDGWVEKVELHSFGCGELEIHSSCAGKVLDACKDFPDDPR
jgi:hypothetical protein